MVTINCAYTESINPPSAHPTLTQSQIWRGLQRKIRHAQDFVPVIEGTDVIEEKDAGREVTRVAHFKAMGERPARSEREVCRSFAPTRVDFWQPDGALITNTVSDGVGLTEHDYNMTYTFEWRYPEVEEGSEEHGRLVQQSRKEAKMAVHSSIESMRRMAAAGELD
ncbi:hypothetical protein B0A55_11102 [Friedmanniomyces simplex]|uniref:DUF1857-domain-containing protein n=1 Tax=Friedmanniomyces simplex TaxID=329884 RepID=A0A4U0W700_9PEZI|nr:hypothetical protein B0A55_11102 [Friedmanniomyces simplex]